MPARMRPRTSRPPGPFRLHCVWGGYGPDEGCGALSDMEWRRSKWRQRLYCQRHRKHVGRLRSPGRVRGDRNGYWLVRTSPTRWRPQHLVIIEQELGRPLTNDEVVLFRDRDPRNLARLNLYLLPAKLLWLRKNYRRVTDGGRSGEPETSR